MFLHSCLGTARSKLVDTFHFRFLLIVVSECQCVCVCVCIWSRMEIATVTSGCSILFGRSIFNQLNFVLCACCTFRAKFRSHKPKYRICTSIVLCQSIGLDSVCAKAIHIFGIFNLHNRHERLWHTHALHSAFQFINL